jgi:hypothetical protein
VVVLTALSGWLYNKVLSDHEELALATVNDLQIS